MAPRRQPPKPAPKPRRKQARTPPAPPPPSAADKLGAAIRGAATRLWRSAGLLAAVVVIGAAIWLGVRQGHEQGNAGFDAPPAAQATSPAAPFRSDRDVAAKLSDKSAFAHTCGTCHTLRAADVSGGIGPDLDRTDRKLTFALVREQIRTGSLDSSMPANLLTGRDADRVARYVARVAR